MIPFFQTTVQEQKRQSPNILKQLIRETPCSVCRAEWVCFRNGEPRRFR